MNLLKCIWSTESSGSATIAKFSKISEDYSTLAKGVNKHIKTAIVGFNIKSTGFKLLSCFVTFSLEKVRSQIFKAQILVIVRVSA